MLDRTKSIGEKLVHWLGGIEAHVTVMTVMRVMILDKPQMGSGKHQVDGGDSVAEMTPPWSFDAFGFHHRDVHHLSATSKFRGRRWLPR